MPEAAVADIEIVVDLPDEAATADLASTLATLARVADVLALSGDLGAGKTTFARAFIRARTGETDDVPSPTFTLVQAYEDAKGTVYHFDLLRIAAPEDAYELGIEEALAEGISLIEWPDRLGSLLPRDRLNITFAFADEPEARTARLAAYADWPGRLKEAGLV